VQRDGSFLRQERNDPAGVLRAWGVASTRMPPASASSDDAHWFAGAQTGRPLGAIISRHSRHSGACLIIKPYLSALADRDGLPRCSLPTSPFTQLTQGDHGLN